ncbi:hypothetical protein Tco_0085629 [Tanacetum coccineum]
MYTFSPMMVANSRKHHCRVRSYTREVLVISTNLDIQKNHYPLDFRNRRGDEARIKNTWLTDYAGASLDRKSTTGGCQFLGCRLISWQCKKQTIVANSTTKAEYVAASSCCGQVKTINGEQQLQALVDGKKIVITEASVRRDLQLDAEEGTDYLLNATIFEKLTRMGALPGEHKDCSSLGDYKFETESQEEDASKQGRKIDDIDADAEITLVDETQGRHDDDLMFDTGVLNDEEVFAEQDMIEKEVSTADPITTAGEFVATITEDELTLAQALAELKSVKPKVTTATTTTTKGILLQEPSESRTTTTTIPSKDKGKAEFDEEVRLAREKDKANVALIEEWNDIQAKIETYYELAQRLQVEEQEELTIEEKSKLFIQLLEARKKHFAIKRAEEKRNRPPIKAQQRSIITELVEGTEMEESSKKAEVMEESSKRAEIA